MNVCTGRFCYFLFVVSVDDENSKDVLAINEVRLSAHKGEHPDDSEDYAAIGLSSEEEAEDLPDSQYIRRKFQIPPPLPPDPVPSVPSAPTGDPSGDTASIQVPIGMLKQVHEALGQLLQGQPLTSGSFGSVPNQPSTNPTVHHEDVPFEVPVIKRGQKICSLCSRKFYSTEAYRRHMKTHTGEQKNVCPNAGCGRKLSSTRSLTEHLKTCGKERNVYCPRKGCKAMFVDLSWSSETQHHSPRI